MVKLCSFFFLVFLIKCIPFWLYYLSASPTQLSQDTFYGYLTQGERKKKIKQTIEYGCCWLSPTRAVPCRHRNINKWKNKNKSSRPISNGFFTFYVSMHRSIIPSIRTHTQTPLSILSGSFFGCCCCWFLMWRWGVRLNYLHISAYNNNITNKYKIYSLSRARVSAHIVYFDKELNDVLLCLKYGIIIAYTIDECGWWFSIVFESSLPVASFIASSC